ncbi:hypothetical protein GLW08_02810 [Pontibacillus yanchengensis]|uniref:Uncharacterized protein n=2 Tax=Pontibacillus yanchengensis TaxID=462910 RepID=A0ACC7VDJ8_9BACI|nr:glycosyltransferase family 39 protein [Pontibacillus yanchengensis]MYL34750.1 hypothetical protein [Pontibacillus yanchengensis]MYL52264.1 hypothetical protein [Pontibacillus yanchengensis]
MQLVRNKNKQRHMLFAWGFFLAIISYTYLFRIFYISPYARSWDQVDFALGVTAFDLYSMQPHFPGYPYFILGGMLTHNVVENPVYALSIFNIVLTYTSIIPMYFLFKRKHSTVMTLLFVALVHSMSYMWVMSTEPMSEAAAVAILWWYVWSLYKASENPKSNWIILPLILFSLLMGVRLSYLPFGIGIVLLWGGQRKHFQTKTTYLMFICSQGLFAIAFQLIWIIGLILSTGSISTFVELAFGFVAGHFTEWGGAVTADTMPLWVRMYNLLFHNLLWSALFTKSWIIAMLYVVLFFNLILYHIRNYKKIDKQNSWVFLLSVMYFIWVLFAQNIDKPRHVLPLLSLGVYLSTGYMKGKGTFITVIISIFLIFSQTWRGHILVTEKTENPPAVYQLTSYLSQVDKPFTVYTWEESRVMEYLDVDYSHKKIFTYEYFQTDLSYKENKRILLTDQVVDGFEMQGYEIQDNIKKVAEFHSNELFDPVYGDIYLYEWNSN